LPQFNRNAALSWTLSALVAWPSALGLACPAFLAAKELPGLAGARRDLRLFALVMHDGKRLWQVLPVQVDPLGSDGVLQAHGDGDPGRESLPVATTDRISLRREGFGLRLAASDPPPCQTPTVIELQNPETPSLFGYLTTCAGGTNQASPDPIVHDAERRQITGERFVYEYQPNNQLMYKTLNAKGPWGKPVLAGSDADLNMHLDIADFFNLDFTNGDVESYVGNVDIGKVGMVASIDFFLRVLFFKINLKMSTTVGFFADAAHIPTVIDVPIDAPGQLNPGSGILYTWVPQGAVIDASKPSATMPIADPKVIGQGFAISARVGLPYCHGAFCSYKLRGTIANEAFGLDVSLPRIMVEHGFYPQWVADVSAFKRALDWPVDDNEAHQVAVYFDNSGLLKGQYKMDQWLRIGKPAAIATDCPRAVNIGKPIRFETSSAKVAH